MISQESLKAKIRNKAKALDINAQQLLQMYFFERILLRISKSKYNDNFILKGGLLLSSLFGNENRTTKDMDTTLKDIPVNKETIGKVLTEILSMDMKDDINLEIVKIEEIIEHHAYGGFRVSIKAVLEGINSDLSIDISTGDEITPREVEYKYKSILNDESYIIMSYPIETVLAEKFETIITRGSSTTRMKDFYDVYMIMKLFGDRLDNKNIVKALDNTFRSRGNEKFLTDMKIFIEEIKESQELKDGWIRYNREYSFSKDIAFDNLIEILIEVENIYNGELIPS